MVIVVLLLEPNQDGRLVYYPGQHLNGTVKLTLGEVKKIRAFYVRVFGKAKTHWTETETRTVGTGDDRRTENHTVHYEGETVYINSKTFLFGHLGGPTVDIQPGIHKYTFTAQLPEQLPYSMDAHHGSIRYYVEAVLDIPWSFDKEIKTPFTVVRYDDLNLYPELAIAQKLEELKTFCCFCCKSGPLLMTASIPCSGFATGQAVPIKIDYSNQSSISVERTHIKLNRTIAYTSQFPHHKIKWSAENMIETYAEGVKGDDKNSIEAFLAIPEVLMNSNEHFCDIIKVSYSIEVIGEVIGCHANPRITFPITIGSVPISQQYQGAPMINQQFPVSPMIPSIMGPQIIPTAPLASDDFDSDLPPSFEEATKSQNLVQQSTQNNLGWNISQPSAPPS